jgi:inorganic triphosphatase YgiF
MGLASNSPIRWRVWSEFCGGSSAALVTLCGDLNRDQNKLQAHIDTLEIPNNLKTLQKLQQDFAELEGRDILVRLKAAEQLTKDMSVDIAILKQSETERNLRLNTAIDSQALRIRSLELEIAEKVAKGDKENLLRLLEWRVDQLETAYTLAKVQGGTREEDARDKLKRAKEDLAKFNGA